MHAPSTTRPAPDYHGVLPAAAAGVEPVPLDFGRLPRRVVRELRASHVGETVAVHLYDGVARATRDEGVLRFAASHRAVEQHHLALFEATVPPRHRSRLGPFWRLAGLLMGGIPARIGPKAFYAVVSAVEHWVDGHYAGQIALVRHLAPDPRLLELLRACRNDEAHHSRDAALAMGRAGWVERLLAWIAVAGSRLGVAVARWV